MKRTIIRCQLVNDLGKLNQYPTEYTPKTKARRTKITCLQTSGRQVSNLFILGIIFAFTLISFVGHGQKMDYKGITQTLKTVCDTSSGGDGAWQILFRGRVMMLIADDNHNRMRIISPIIGTNQLEADQYETSLLANFHSVLDAKYAISDDVMWSVFIHPLKELSRDQLKNAIEQVYLAAETFGSSYQSTDLIFPLPPQEVPKKEKKSKEPKKQKL